jgi:hypothetical protein
MALYRCFLLSPDEHVLAPAEVIDASDDRAAIEQARIVCEGQKSCATVEVWMGDRRVGLFTPN